MAVAPLAPADAGSALEEAERLVKRVSSEWALASFLSEETALLEVAPFVAADVCDAEAALGDAVRFVKRLSPELEPVSFLSECATPLEAAPLALADV